jgi:hypothetical protein
MIEFPDVSHYTPVNLTGAVAAVAKVSQGLSYVDPTYANFRKQAAALRIPFSGYHWVDDTDPAGQASNYHDHAAGAPCMWDAEAPGATVPRILAATAALKALGGRAWGVYLPHWWWQGHIGAPDLRPLQQAGLVLVSSNYTTAPGAGWLPYGGVTPTVWQYTDHQVLNGVPCDFNRYQGTVAQLAALFAGTIQPHLEQEDDMRMIRDNSTTSIYLMDGTDPTGKPVLFPISLMDQVNAYKAAGVPYTEVGTVNWAYYTKGPLPTSPGGGPSGPVDLTDAAVTKVAGAVVDEEHNRLAQ